MGSYDSNERTQFADLLLFSCPVVAGIPER